MNLPKSRSLALIKFGGVACKAFWGLSQSVKCSLEAGVARPEA